MVFECHEYSNVRIRGICYSRYSHVHSRHSDYIHVPTTFKTSFTTSDGILDALTI